VTTLRDRFAACRTAADFYRVQIEAENILSPAEVAALDPAELPPPAAAWQARLSGMMGQVAPAVQAFRRRDLSDHASFFEGAGDAGAGRCLVVGFTGIALRMNVPAPVFLQALPAAACDVVILRDPGRAAFLAGVPGYAPDLPALAERLAADLPGGRHPGGWRCIGTSAGGAAALYFGRLAGARRAVSVDGGHPAGFSLPSAGALDRRAFDVALEQVARDRHRPASPPGQPSRMLSLGGRVEARADAGSAEADNAPAGRPPGEAVLIAAHGVGDPRDALRGRLLAAGLPGARALTVAVEGPHGLLGTLLARRLLARFLAEVLLDDTPPGALPAAWPPEGPVLSPAAPRGSPG
jgi:hypothetical protein